MLYMLAACTLSSGWTVKMSMELNYAVNSEWDILAEFFTGCALLKNTK